jgi:hypothetical protein
MILGMHLHKVSIAVFVCLLLTVPACGAASSTPSRAAQLSPATSATPSPSSSPTPTAAPIPTASPSPTKAELHFTTAMVRANKVNKKYKGGQANVFVVAPSTDVDALERVGRECVEHFLQEQKAAFCHVWGSQANFEARDPRRNDELRCWTHYIGVPLVGGDPYVTTAASYSYKIEGCPTRVFR